ncbi:MULTISPECIES: NAD(P)-dependent alcohol dehydrogenase [Niastella]|uniref:NAD(P)-dependent alcohol dehydrogenase n=1 Tax=Niastella soli TaxID=2821487 RepID=A0ABS3YVX4_9BACT|nr:NAD(P)-dependent alcohol dehydrogenase [Niastella soli]MBO9201984.1 NAD(P)-dependent alcohol dehydrogenase [Niastella soli]
METFKVKAYGTEAADAPFHNIEIKRRNLLPDDVEIDILYCGICHSDLHAVKNDWGGTIYPIVPGHEIVGRITQVGTEVTKFKVGDLAAIGCIVDSCGHCHQCDNGEEQFCEKGWTVVFNAPDKVLGGQTYGGFSEKIVAKANYVLKMPENIDLAASAPILCAGITVYSPLKHWKIGAGTKVGIIGIGGLGHMAIKIAKAMGAYVVVFTTSTSKIDDAKKLGADEAVLSTDKAQMKAQAGFDMILDTVSAKHDVNTYLNALKVDGSLVLVGLPNQPLEIGAFNVVNGRKSFSGSNIGGIAETQEVIDFCASHNITADIELITVDQINEAFERLEKGDVKYRFVIDIAASKK